MNDQAGRTVFGPGSAPGPSASPRNELGAVKGTLYINEVASEVGESHDPGSLINRISLMFYHQENRSEYLASIHASMVQMIVFLIGRRFAE